MHWTTKTAIGAGITVVVTAVLVGGWATYRNTLKIPGLEEASARQQKDIAYLKVSMLTLMQKTGHPPAKEDLQNLISSVGEFGASTAHLVKSANIVITGRPLTYYAWVPPHAQDTLRRHVVT